MCSAYPTLWNLPANDHRTPIPPSLRVSQVSHIESRRSQHFAVNVFFCAAIHHADFSPQRTQALISERLVKELNDGLDDFRIAELAVAGTVDDAKATSDAGRVECVFE